MSELQFRKQALLLESELNRLELQAHWASLRESTGWMRSAKELTRQFGPLALAIAGFVSGLRRNRRTTSGDLLQHLLALATVLIDLLRNWSKPEPTKPPDNG